MIIIIYLLSLQDVRGSYRYQRNLLPECWLSLNFWQVSDISYLIQILSPLTVSRAKDLLSNLQFVLNKKENISTFHSRKTRDLLS